MDSQFLEFWGNLLLAAARGQKQLEDVARWMQQGLKMPGFEGVADFFSQAYGLPAAEDRQPPGKDPWTAAADRFLQAFAEYAAMMGMVPTPVYHRLEEKYSALEAKCREQEETIAHLRGLLGASGAGQEEAVEAFQAILEKQSGQFQELLNSSAQFLAAAAAPPKGKKAHR